MWLGEPRLAIAAVLLVHSWRLMHFHRHLARRPHRHSQGHSRGRRGGWGRLLAHAAPDRHSHDEAIISVAVLFGLIFTFTDMTVVYILTAGGPFDSTQTLPSLAFAMGIQGSDLAAGAAISLFLVPLLVILAYFMLRIAHRAEVN